MSKDRKIDDAELANISGAGDVNLEKVDSGIEEADGGGGNLTGSKRPVGGGGGGGAPGGVEHDNESGGDVNIGPA